MDLSRLRAQLCVNIWIEREKNTVLILCCGQPSALANLLHWAEKYNLCAIPFFGILISILILTPSFFILILVLILIPSFSISPVYLQRVLSMAQLLAGMQYVRKRSIPVFSQFGDTTAFFSPVHKRLNLQQNSQNWPKQAKISHSLCKKGYQLWWLGQISAMKRSRVLGEA